MESRNQTNQTRGAILLAGVLILLASVTTGRAEIVRLQSDALTLEVDDGTAAWKLLDKRSGVAWPSSGTAGPGNCAVAPKPFLAVGEREWRRLSNWPARRAERSCLPWRKAVRPWSFATRSPARMTLRILSDALAIGGDGRRLCDCPEPGGTAGARSKGDKAFKRVFGTSEYEGCHMNMLGFVKDGSALIVTWDDAYVFPELERTVSGGKHKLTTTFELRGSAQVVRLMPLGKGDWNTIAREYRRYAEERGLAVTLKEKIRRDPHVELMVGAPTPSSGRA